MHVNVIMGGQLDEHLLFWQPTISTTLYVIALYLVWFLRWKLNIMMTMMLTFVKIKWTTGVACEQWTR